MVAIKGPGHNIELPRGSPSSIQSDKAARRQGGQVSGEFLNPTGPQLPTSKSYTGLLHETMLHVVSRPPPYGVAPNTFVTVVGSKQTEPVTVCFSGNAVCVAQTGTNEVTFCRLSGIDRKSVERFQDAVGKDKKVSVIHTDPNLPARLEGLLPKKGSVNYHAFPPATNTSASNASEPNGNLFFAVSTQTGKITFPVTKNKGNLVT